MDITSILTENLRGKAIEAISKKAGTTNSESKKMLAKALPIILWKLRDNSKDPIKSKSLEKAVKENDWGVIDNLENIDLKDWAKILWHIFWDKKDSVQKEIWNKESSEAIASLVMGLLWKANSESWKSASDLLSDSSIIWKLAISFLDKDWDWEIKDDIFTMIISFLKSLIKGKK